MAEESLRETLEKSMATVESAAVDSGGTGDSSGADTVGEANEAASAESQDKTPVEGQDKATTEGQEKVPAEGADKAPVEGDKKPVAEGDKKLAIEGDKKPAVKVEAKGVRAPESWKPAIRDKHWKTLPTEVQMEILRRERQTDEALQGSAESRKGMEQVQGVFGQFKDFFEFEKLSPLQTVQNTLNMMRALRFAQPPQKAQVMAQMIAGFDVDVTLLDKALSMVVKPSDPATAAQRETSSAVQAILQRELAPLRDMMKGVTAQREQQRQQEHNVMVSEIQTFADDPQNVYFDQVRESMADIMEAGAARGQKITLSDAYKRAILANNDLAEVYSQDQLKQAARKVNAPAEAARRRAAQSVTGSPSTAVSAEVGGSIRDALEAAIVAHSGRA